MTFPVWIEVVCANCARSTAGRFTYRGQIPLRKLKGDAKLQGWIFKYDDCFCSARCVQRYLERKNDENFS